LLRGVLAKSKRTAEKGGKRHQKKQGLQRRWNRSLVGTVTKSTRSRGWGA